MKVISFTKWHWKKIPVWGKIYLFNLCLLTLSVFLSYPYDFYIAAFSLLNLMIFLLSTVIDMIKSSYHQFEKEQDNLLKTIKNSDKN